MKRRTAIRNVVLVTGGAAFLYACQDASEEDLLSELTETIIPQTDFPGAKDLKTAEFISMMGHDCLSPEDQTKFSNGMKAFDETCKSKMGSKFVKLSKEKRGEFLGMIEADKDGKELGEDVKSFYSSVKGGTIHNFTTSERYLKEVRNFTSLVPPKFQACVPVTNV